MAPQATAPQSFAPERAIETAAPRVTLRNSFAHPSHSAIAAARTCYSPRIIGPEEVSEKQRINLRASPLYGRAPPVLPPAPFHSGVRDATHPFSFTVRPPPP